MEQQARAKGSEWGRKQTEHTEFGRQLLKVQEEERRRIARDLHDHLAQRLALLEMGLERLRQGLSGDVAQLRSEALRLQEQTRALCQDVRDLSHRLHPTIIEHLGLVAALKALCSEYQRSRVVPVRFEAIHDGRAIPSRVATAYYRICEKALCNIQKHAGDVAVVVHVQAEGAELRLRIQDRGPGFNPAGIDPTQHLGW